MSELGEVRTSGNRFSEVGLMRVWNALNRSSSGLDSFQELFNGLHRDRRPPLSSEARFAVGFDTNTLYRLGIGSQGANSLDYLSQRHAGPVIIPGQVVQEVWNNFLAGVQPKAKAVAKKLEDLEAEMDAIGQELGPLGETARKAVTDLIESHGDWTDASAIAEFDSTVETLLRVARVPYVPREEFYQLALVRKETKTPPGFKDEARNFGDYFVWADFLYGLAEADLTEVEAVVFVTGDAKKDWSTNGVPHPILAAEARAVSGKEFHLWNPSDFQRHIKTVVS